MLGTSLLLDRETGMLKDSNNYFDSRRTLKIPQLKDCQKPSGNMLVSRGHGGHGGHGDHGGNSDICGYIARNIWLNSLQLLCRI